MSSIDERQQQIPPWQRAGNMHVGQGMLSVPAEQQATATPEQLSFPTPPPSAYGTAQPSQERQYPSHDATYSAQPRVTRQLADYAPMPVPVQTRQLHDYTPAPVATQTLPEVQTGTLPSARRTTTSLREPVVIRGTGKKSKGIRPPKGRKLVVHIATIAVLILIGLGALIAVVPTGSEGEGLWNPFKATMDMAKGSNNNPGLIAQQAATATAVTQDGYDPGGGQTFAGLPTAPPGSGSGGGLDRFFYGQCTYWANMRYHQLTGYWVPWLGNAWQWKAGAIGYGWVVSATPKVPSIIVLQPGVQGSGWYGHVAIVERINADGSVLTSNFNWAGNWAIETFVTFTPGPGVSFVWHP